MLQKKDVILLILGASSLFLLLAIFLLLFVQIYGKRKRQMLLEKNLLEKQFEQTLLQSRVEIQEQTLQHIGLELHDNLGHIASLLKMNLEVLRIKYPGAVAEDVNETLPLLQRMLDDIKSISVGLSAGNLRNHTLTEVLRSETERLNRGNLCRAVFIQEGDPPGLELTAATILYRIAQEAVNNAIKHSGASAITLRLRGRDGYTMLVVEDDGPGFSVAEARASDGAGLRNMERRAAMLGATFNIRSTPQSGTSITIRCPGHPAHE